VLNSHAENELFRLSLRLVQLAARVYWTLVQYTRETEDYLGVPLELQQTVSRSGKRGMPALPVTRTSTTIARPNGFASHCGMNFYSLFTNASSQRPVECAAAYLLRLPLTICVSISCSWGALDNHESSGV
jgi:hypothetical protein